MRKLPDGSIVMVRYGVWEIKVLDEVTGGDIEVWNGLKLPPGIDLLLGVTALEEMDFKVDPKAGWKELSYIYFNDIC